MRTPFVNLQQLGGGTVCLLKCFFFFWSFKFACTIAQEDLIVLRLYICNSIPRRDWKISWCLRCACFMFMLEKRSIEKPAEKPADFMLCFLIFLSCVQFARKAWRPRQTKEEVGLFPVWPDCWTAALLLLKAVDTDLLFCRRSWDVLLTAIAEAVLLRLLGDFDVAEEQC